jgi:DNA-binding transcriptional regulator YiaG
MSVIDETRIQNASPKTGDERGAPKHNAATEVVGSREAETADDRLLNRVSALRDRTHDLDTGARTLHNDVRMYELDERTTATALRNPASLLRQLSHEYALSWAAIARLAGVTPTAVRKWRRGETVSADNRRSIARAVTFLEMLTENAGPLEDLGSWLEMPLSDVATITPLDLYVGGQFVALLDHVGGHLKAHPMLDQFDPAWREDYGRDSAFDVVQADDGQLSITERSKE